MVTSLVTIEERIELGARMILSSLASTEAFKQLDKDRIESSFRNLVKLNPDYANFHAVLPDGTVFASAKPIPRGGVSLADRKHVIDALATKGFSIGEYVVSRLTFEPVLPFAFPVLDDHGEVCAVIIAVIRLTSFSKYFTTPGNGHESAVILLDHDFRVLLKRPQDVDMHAPGEVAEGFKRIIQNEERFDIRSDPDGIERLYATGSVMAPGHGKPYLYICVGMPTSLTVSKSRNAVLSWAYTTFAVLLCSLALATLLIKRRLSRNIQTIVEASDKVIHGDFSARTNITCSDGDLGVVGEAIDSMVAKVAEGVKRLRESEERFRTLVEQAPEAIIVSEAASSTVHLVNQKAVELFGCSREELAAHGIHRFYHATQPDGRDYRDSIADCRRRAMAGEHVTVERVITTAQGVEKTCEVRLVRFPSKEMDLVRSSWTDITLRKQMEAALVDSENRFRVLIETLPIGILLFDIVPGGLAFTAANPAARRMLGIVDDSLFFRPMVEVFPSLAVIDPARAVEAAYQGRDAAYHSKLRLDDARFHGVYELYSFLPKPATFALLFLDVSENHRMQEMMIQTEKMMNIGGLAAGMAHEINNPLSAILQSVQVVERRLLQTNDLNVKTASEVGCPMDSIQAFCDKRDITGMVRGIKEAGSRAARIVSGMLEFSRKVESNRAPTDLKALMDKAVELCSNDYDLKKKYDFRRIVITRQYQDAMPEIPCTATQVQQVLMNLLKNAAQAMSGKTGDAGPSITVRVYEDGDDGVVEIEDNGPGMEEAVREHIFEPFYTTKPAGEGTGLGLSVSHFLIKEKHQGTMTVESAPGKGAKFVIRLPLRGKEPKATT